MATKKPRFQLMKVYRERARLIEAYRKRRRIDLQDALDDVIVAGLKVKRLLPSPAQDTQPESELQS